MSLELCGGESWLLRKLLPTLGSHSQRSGSVSQSGAGVGVGGDVCVN